MQVFGCHLPLVYSLLLSGFIHFTVLTILKFTSQSAAICMPLSSCLLLFDISSWVGCHHNPHIKLAVSRTEFPRLPLKPSLFPSLPALSVTSLSLSSLGDDLLDSLTSVLPDEPKCHCHDFLLPHLWVSLLGPKSISNSKS